ncbi:MAG TPA: NusG domain II-containing protein [Firmicutes bacterium]|nr:NusG domain II-containing protein [Bacillota bacterium]
MKFNGRTKGDLILIVALVVFGLGALVYNHVVVPRRGQASRVIVEIEGEVVQELSLLRDTEGIRFNSGRGYNVVEIKDGRVRISEANCPDKLCVNTGWREHVGQVIVCLPHHFVIKIEGNADSQSGIDSYAY